MPSSPIKVELTPKLGKVKQELFRQAFHRIDRAIKLGFHLEAITLIESMLCDRLESAIAIKLSKQVSPTTLGPLINQIKKLELFEIDTIEAIDEWRDSRNLVLHQMVKLTSSEDTSWRSRMNYAKYVALEGRTLLKKVHAQVARMKKI